MPIKPLRHGSPCTCGPRESTIRSRDDFVKFNTFVPETHLISLCERLYTMQHYDLYAMLNYWFQNYECLRVLPVGLTFSDVLITHSRVFSYTYHSPFWAWNHVEHVVKSYATYVVVWNSYRCQQLAAEILALMSKIQKNILETLVTIYHTLLNYTIIRSFSSRQQFF